MPLVAAAVCPHPPLLVPEVASGAAAELDDLRAACDAAVGHLLAAGPTGSLTVGSGPEPSGAELGRGDLPLSRAVGVWLLARAGLAEAPAAGHIVAPDAARRECSRLGRSIAADAERVALLVLGDGSACRSVKAPGYFDERAEPFDAGVARALGGRRRAGAARPGPGPGRRAAVRRSGAVAGARRRGGWPTAGPGTVACTTTTRPYGVAYFVATWSPVCLAPLPARS